ncbi:hypothetical protein M5689_000047 [Euphorbia peplus]|nr:hypothetical protein M5689_000047 [Euphorbia peplus]
MRKEADPVRKKLFFSKPGEGSSASVESGSRGKEPVQPSLVKIIDLQPLDAVVIDREVRRMEIAVQPMLNQSKGQVGENEVVPQQCLRKVKLKKKARDVKHDSGGQLTIHDPDGSSESGRKRAGDVVMEDSEFQGKIMKRDGSEINFQRVEVAERLHPSQ